MNSECNNALLRLTRMIRGIGDPLVAIYVRCYLIRVGMTVTNDKKYIKENFNDILTVYHTVINYVTYPGYSHLLISVLDF